MPYPTIALLPLSIGGYLVRSTPPQKLGRPPLEHGLALVEHEAIEGPDGEDLGVPVVQHVALRLGELGGGEALHARSAPYQTSDLTMELADED